MTSGGNQEGEINLGTIRTNDFDLVVGKEYLFNLSQKTSVSANSVPEPTSIALMGLGLLGFAATTKKRKAV